jgi:hypothetical protein
MPFSEEKGNCWNHPQKGLRKKSHLTPTRSHHQVSQNEICVGVGRFFSFFFLAFFTAGHSGSLTGCVKAELQAPKPGRSQGRCKRWCPGLFRPWPSRLRIRRAYSVLQSHWNAARLPVADSMIITHPGKLPSSSDEYWAISGSSGTGFSEPSPVYLAEIKVDVATCMPRVSSRLETKILFLHIKGSPFLTRVFQSYKRTRPSTYTTDYSQSYDEIRRCFVIGSGGPSKKERKKERNGVHMYKARIMGGR